MDRTAELLADPGFRRRVRAVEFELWERPVMSGDQVALLLEDSSVAEPEQALAANIRHLQ